MTIFVSCKKRKFNEHETYIRYRSCRSCKGHLIQHRDDSGVFTVRGERNGCGAAYKVTFAGNIAIAAGGSVEPISVSFALDGETLNGTTAKVTPAAIGDFFHVSISTIIETIGGCCESFSIENTSATTPIDVQNANLIIERIR